MARAVLCRAVHYLFDIGVLMSVRVVCIYVKQVLAIHRLDSHEFLSIFRRETEYRKSSNNNKNQATTMVDNGNVTSVHVDHVPKN